MANLTPTPLDTSLFNATLNARNSMKMVLDLSNGYNSLTQLVDMINVNGSKEVSTYQGKYEKPRRGRLQVVSQISANAQTGANLTLTLSNPNYNNFRVGDYVMDSNQIKAQVYQTPAPGTIVIAPVGTALVAASHFTAAMYVKALGITKGLRASTGTTSLYSVPNIVYNYSSVFRETCFLAHSDMIDTYVQTMDGMWYTAAEMDMIERLGKTIELNYWFSDLSQFTSPIDGVSNKFGGLRYSIIRDGVYIPATSVNTAATFQQTLSRMAALTVNKGRNLKIMLGTDALVNIQANITANFIQFGGNTNTFGGKTVDGLNVMRYALGGISGDLIIAPVLDDPDLFPELSTISGVTGRKMSNSIYFLDTDDIPSVGGLGLMPPIEKFHFGKFELGYSQIKGTVDASGNSAGGTTSGNYGNTNSDVAGVTCQVYGQLGLDVVGTRMGLWELVS